MVLLKVPYVFPVVCVDVVGVAILLLLLLLVVPFQFVAASAPTGSHMVKGICRKNNSMALASC
jgi:hypothetical protein